MMRQRLNNWIWCLAGVLLCLTLFSFRLTAGLYARYTSTATASDSARVAKFVVDLVDLKDEDEKKTFVDISDICKPGDSVTYKFQVTNTSGSAVSEVDETYLLNMELRGNLPLECSLKKDSAEVIALNAKSITDNPPAVTGAVPQQAFAASVAEGHNYTLQVTWPDAENSYLYANGGVAELMLTVAVQQVD